MGQNQSTKTNTYLGHIVDIRKRRVFSGEIRVENGYIASITEIEGLPSEAPYYLPGFIDSHVHIESSMMVPAEFARLAVKQGTIGVITDPHEIANVLGVDGVHFMIENGRLADFNFCFGAPSCVPSCSPDIETSGAILTSKEVSDLLAEKEIGFLSEMMNFPGVLNQDEEVIRKIESAKLHGKPVDGHAPSLRGEMRKQYASAGITTDHETSSLEEGRDCIESGMKLLIREGSAARNYEALIPLLREYPGEIMFCTDDSHPGDLMQGHINRIVCRALAEGYDLWDILQAACLTPQEHYDLDWGTLQTGDKANFIAVDCLDASMTICATYIQGEEVYRRDSFASGIRSMQKSLENQTAILNNYPNQFTASYIETKDIQMEYRVGQTIHIILAEDGSLLTGHDKVTLTDDNPKKQSDYPWNEVQKIVVYNRYSKGAKPVVGLIRGFHLQDGAMAASIAHDCHNIVAIGSSDEYIVKAINRVIELQGGEVAIAGSEIKDLPLPIAGIISPLSGEEVAYRSDELQKLIAKAGCTMKSPFITMNFMCLPVIPYLKLTDKGLWDMEKWSFL